MVIQNDGWWSYSPEKMRTMLIEGNRLGWRFAIHGAPHYDDGGTRLLLGALEDAHAENSLVGRRFTYEHGFGLLSPEFHRRFHDLGFIIAANPALAYYAASRTLEMHQVMDDVRISKDTSGTAWEKTVKGWGLPLRSWSNAGLVVTLGTDCPACHYDPDRPLLGMYAACTQGTLAGQLLPNETVTRDEALRMATINNAFATFEETTKGSLEVGKLADLVILSANPLTSSDDELLATTVLETVVGGRTVYERAI